MPKCYICKQRKPADQFYRDASRRQSVKVSSRCKECNRLYDMCRRQGIDLEHAKALRRDKWLDKERYGDNPKRTRDFGGGWSYDK